MPSESFLIGFVTGVILASVPLLIAAVGETISERSGVLNVGVEGMMLAGAYGGFSAALAFGNPSIGIALGGVAGVVVSLVMVLFCVRLGLDQIVVGIAVTLSMQGTTSLLHGAQYGTSYPRLDAMPTVPIPLLSSLPVLGPSLFTQPVVVYLAVLLIPLTGWILQRTRFGLNIRVAGEKPEALEAAGVNVVDVRTWTVLTCGCLSGIAGAYMSIVAAGTFVPFMTNGMGFIAIVIAMLGSGKPWRVLLAALVFGVAVSGATSLQLLGVVVPLDLVLMMPFVAVMLFLVVLGRRSSLPVALGQPYVRGSR